MNLFAQVGHFWSDVLAASISGEVGGHIDVVLAQSSVCSFPLPVCFFLCPLIIDRDVAVLIRSM